MHKKKQTEQPCNNSKSGRWMPASSAPPRAGSGSLCSSTSWTKWHDSTRGLKGSEQNSDLGVVRRTIAKLDLGKVVPLSTTLSSPTRSIGDSCWFATWTSMHKKKFRLNNLVTIQSLEGECQPHQHHLGLAQAAFVPQLPEQNDMTAPGDWKGAHKTVT